MKEQKSYIKIISAEATIAVRQPILREGMPIKDCIFEGDEKKSTLHLGIFLDQNLVGVVTYMKNSHEQLSASNQYQLRGMAVLATFQQKDLGTQLLNEGEKLLKEKGTQLIWCNAREVAVSFYEKNGFKIIGDSFNIPTVGIHYAMWKEI